MNDPSTDSQNKKTEGRQEVRSRGGSLQMLFLFFATLSILYLGLSLVGTAEFLISIRVLIILIGALLPAIIYNYFIYGRLPTLFAEYKQNLRRLGMPENAQQYRDKFEQVYGGRLDAGLGQFTRSPILIATLLTLIGWILVFYPEGTDLNALTPNPSPMAYGFLGAYVFGLGALIRQFVTDDLQPRYYASLSYRYMTVFILSWLIFLLVQTGTENTDLKDNVLLAALVIGLFPTVGLRVAQLIGTAALSIPWKGFEEGQPLSQLDGINAFHEDRLLLEGIENLQNLSSVNLVDLMLKTRFPVEQIVDWIDQALLRLHTREITHAFLGSGLRTATDFIDFYEPGNEPSRALKSKRKDFANLIITLSANSKEEETDLAELTTEDTMIRLDAIATGLLLDPNYFHVRYWRDHEFEALPEDVEQHRTQADLKLMQGLPGEAIAAYDELLRTFPRYYGSLLYRGMAYFASGDYSRAIEDYTTAIIQGGHKWEGARHAYVERGRALREMGEFKEAAANYQEALAVYDEFPEALFELAYVQMSTLRQYDKAIENFRALLETNFRRPDVLANLGASLYQRWLQTDKASRIDEHLEEARSSLTRSISQSPDLIPAYINLAEVFREQKKEAEALRILTEVIFRLETLRDPKNTYRVRLRRGRIHLGRGDLDLAVEDYLEATRLNPIEFEAFFNLGFTLRRLNRLDESADALRRAVELKPRHTVAQLELGDVALELKQVEEAEAAYSAYLEMMREDDDRNGVALAHLKLGRLYKQMKDRTSDARRELEQAIQTAADFDIVDVYTYASYELGLLEMGDEDYDVALSLLKTSAELFTVREEVRAEVRAYLAICVIHIAQNDPDAARETLEKAKEQLDSVFQPKSREDKELQKKIQKCEDELS